MPNKPPKPPSQKADEKKRLHLVKEDDPTAAPVDAAEEGADGKKGQWSGRFAKKLDPMALDFTKSIHFDWHLYFFDIRGSQAHARMLCKIGLLTEEEKDKILDGLEDIMQDIQDRKFDFKDEFEDIHLNIEKALVERIGPLGGKLHTARSRNDQVALDFRLYCRSTLDLLRDKMVELLEVFLNLSEKNLGVVVPGYTHLQRAQPILWSHHLMAYVEMLSRDLSRMTDALQRLNSCPLGSGAMAGTTFPLDRDMVAQDLGFFEPTHNSLDGVSDRDFAIEIAATLSILMMHYSRLSEELILWSSSEFSFIKLPEAFCTGSSMMPQKMNPDVPELIRGKTGRVYGHLMSLLTLMKSLPLAYNKDMQEDKEAVFDSFQTAIACTDILIAMMPGVEPQAKKMMAAAQDGGLLATDLADWLVRQGVDFRTCHEVTAKIVRYSIEKEKDLTELTLGELKKFHEGFNEGVFEAIQLMNAINQRKVLGGTAQECVEKEIKRHRDILNKWPLPPSE